MYKRILVATDGSEHALNAAYTAARLAKELGSELTLLYVYTPPVRVTAAAIDTVPDNDPAVVETVQHAVLDRTAAVVREENTPFTTRAEVGYPAELIVGIAADDEYDLIVIGSRGLGGIKALVLGSVSDRVAHAADCAVLGVK